MANEAGHHRILLFGANGQLGHELRHALGSLGEVEALTRADADFSHPESLRLVIRRRRPDVVVNAAAYTAVDKAESESDLALTVNAIAPGVLAEEAETLGACLVHYSTDFVFDGKQGEPYSENAEPHPLSAYGRSKFAGERSVSGRCRRHLILRTGWVFGRHGSNFLKTMLRLAAEKSSFGVVNDQSGTPTSTALIAETSASLLQVMASTPAGDDRWGIYHIAASGDTTWHAYARYIIEQARAMGLSLKSTGESISPISTAEYPLPAVRPAYSVLDTSKLQSAFGLRMPCWKLGVDRVLNDIVSKPV